MDSYYLLRLTFKLIKNNKNPFVSYFMTGTSPLKYYNKTKIQTKLALYLQLIFNKNNTLRV